MLDAVVKIQKYTEKHNNSDDFYEDTVSFDATMMNFILIGEMAEKLSDEFKEDTESQIDRYRIKGFRNIIAHNYFGVDAEETWQIIKNNLPKLRIFLEKEK